MRSFKRPGSQQPGLGSSFTFGEWLPLQLPDRGTHNPNRSAPWALRNVEPAHKRAVACSAILGLLAIVTGYSALPRVRYGKFFGAPKRADCGPTWARFWR